MKELVCVEELDFMEQDASDVSASPTAKQERSGSPFDRVGELRHDASPSSVTAFVGNSVDSVGSETKMSMDRVGSGLSQHCRQLAEEVIQREDSASMLSEEGKVLGDGIENRRRRSTLQALHWAWVFVGKVEWRPDEEDDADTLRWKSRCEGTFTFASGLLHYLVFYSGLFHWATGHRVAASFAFGEAVVVITAFLIARTCAAKGWLSPDRAISCFALVVMTVTLAEFIKQHICLGGGLHASDVIIGSIMAPCSALFHLRSRPVLAGAILHGVRTLLCIALLLFDNKIASIDAPPRGWQQLWSLVFNHFALPLAFVFSLWKAMARVTQWHRSLSEIVECREAKREANLTLIHSLFPPSKTHQIEFSKQPTETAFAQWSLCPEEYADCSLLQMDISGFTALSSDISAAELVDLINAIFTSIDEAAALVGCVWKVETVGDCYKAMVGGIFPCDDHAHRAVALGLAIIDVVEGVSRRTGLPLTVRCGVARGPVTGDMMGSKLPRYLLHGKTCQVVGRLEHSAEAGTVLCAEEAVGAFAGCGRGQGPVEVPGGGEVQAVTLKPDARSRKAMADGLVRAAELDRLLALFRLTDSTEAAPGGEQPEGENAAGAGSGAEGLEGRGSFADSLRHKLDTLDKEFASISSGSASVKDPSAPKRSLFYSATALSSQSGSWGGRRLTQSQLDKRRRSSVFSFFRDEQDSLTESSLTSQFEDVCSPMAAARARRGSAARTWGTRGVVHRGPDVKTDDGLELSASRVPLAQQPIQEVSHSSANTMSAESSPPATPRPQLAGSVESSESRPASLGASLGAKPTHSRVARLQGSMPSGAERESLWSRRGSKGAVSDTSEEREERLFEEEGPDDTEGEGEGRELSAVEQLAMLSGEAEHQAAILTAMLGVSLAGTALHVVVLLVVAAQSHVQGDERTAGALSSSAMLPAACAAALCYMLHMGLPREAVQGHQSSRRIAWDVTWLVLTLLPLTMMAGGRGLLVQSCVLWYLPPLLLLVRCSTHPTWTAVAAWSAYLAVVVATHLSAPSLELVRQVAESEGRVSVWSQPWWVSLLSLVNLMLPTTAALYPYMVTAGQLHSATARVEADHAALDWEGALQTKLLSLLVPRPIAERLQRGERRIADQVEAATVLFVYVQDVDAMLSAHGAADVMTWLNLTFEALDACVSTWACQLGPEPRAGRARSGHDDDDDVKFVGGESSVLKVETFNDFYLAISGCAPQHSEGGGDASAHVDDAVRAGLEMARVACSVTRPDGQSTTLKIGLNSGSVCAGVISTAAPRFSIFGDTVNVASRMASTAEASREGAARVHLSEATARGVSAGTEEVLRERGLEMVEEELMEIKGKGPMQTWTIQERA